jgi:hypothetical protein
LKRKNNIFTDKGYFRVFYLKNGEIKYTIRFLHNYAESFLRTCFIDMQSIALELWRLRLEEKQREEEEKAALAAEEEKRFLLEAAEAQSQHQPTPDPGVLPVEPEGEVAPQVKEEIEGQTEKANELDVENDEEGKEKEETPVKDEEGD